jgi:type IV fimbrial biogenesis protein FimT
MNLMYMKLSSNPKEFIRAGPRGYQTGFSLIEILIAIAILAILIALAQPVLTSVINGGRLSGAGNELLATMQSARIEAIRRNARVVVCASNNADSSTPTCASGAGSRTGWISFVDDGGGAPANARNTAFNAGETLLRANAMTDNLQVLNSTNVAAAQAVVFRSDGLARASSGGLLNGSIAVCMLTTSPEQNVRVFQIGSGSRMSVSKASGSGNCNAPND